tara:strand:- start:768 stop:1031 length:264 start_codon:yes stop_codon:yes gene_type:complete
MKKIKKASKANEIDFETIDEYQKRLDKARGKYYQDKGKSKVKTIGMKAGGPVKSKLKKVIKGLQKASKSHLKQAKILKSVVSKGKKK